MKTIIINKSQHNKKIVQVITSVFPEVSLSSVYKALRRKDIKINGKRIKEDISVRENDFIEIFIDDSILIKEASLTISYEDNNILIIDKPQGLKVHPDGENNIKSLIEILNETYKMEIYLCHRLDRNTGGLIIAAKDKLSAEIISNKIKTNEIRKIYRCRVHGKPPKQHDILSAHHTKSSKNSLVFISDEQTPSSKKILTEYQFISFDKDTNTSILEITLITGKTHQIRAHMAHIGLPVVGDGKYGSNKVKKQLGEKQKYQSLFSHKIEFSFTSPAGKLDYLKNKIILRQTSEL